MGVRLEIRITQSDLGKRVSVRSLTGHHDHTGRTDHTGHTDTRGPRFTDTVGVLTDWSGGQLRITRRNGEQVRLDEAAVVAAKVVPAAPARRGGTPSAGTGELVDAAARGWPAAESEIVGGWLCRARDGWTGRANSALPRFTPDGSPAPDLDAITSWYRVRGITPLLHLVTGTADGHEVLGAELDGLGWATGGHAVVRIAPLAPLADRAPDPRVVLHRELTEPWLSGYPNAARNPAAARRLLPSGASVWFATVPRPPGSPGSGPDAGPAAIGRCSVDGRWAGFAAIQVASDQRRQGLAQAVMAELARAALAEGASAAHLQVERDNQAAHTLYDRLGFTDHHHYHYRRPPG